MCAELTNYQVQQDLNRQLKACRQGLEALGASRKTPEEQHEYLFDIATRFQDMASRALRTDYGGSPIFDTKPSLRLATRVVERNDSFAEDVQQVGHAMEFHDVKSDLFDPGDQDFFEKVRRTGGHWELEDILIQDPRIPKPEREGMLQWLETVYKTSRGFEMGTFDATIFPTIFKKQSSNWEPLALGYVSDIISHIHDFILNLTSSLCPDKQVQKGIMSAIMDPLMGCYKKSLDHAKFILGVERAGTPMTLNHYYNDNLQKL